MTRPSFRVHLARHDGGFATATVMAAGRLPAPAPAVFGRDEGELFEALEDLTRRYLADHPEVVGQFSFVEDFEMKSVKVIVHPLTRIGEVALIGQRPIELRVRYAAAVRPEGGVVVSLPRFGWWFVAEDLEVAGEAIKAELSAALLGVEARWIFEFRDVLDELVRAWDPFPATAAPLPVEEPENADFRDVADDLVRAAKRGKLEAVVPGRPLSGPLVPGVVLLVGPAGAGKSAAVRALAFQLASKNPPPDLAGRHIHSTTAERLIAGMTYLGMWQDRVLRLIDALTASQDILAVDRLTALLRPQAGGSSIAELLRPALAAKQIRLVTECTPEELADLRPRHPAFLALFEVVELAEADPVALPTMMRAYQAKRRHRITVSAGAERRSIRHLAQFQPHRAFPGKAFRFLDWLNRVEDAKSSTLGAGQASAAFAEFASLPIELISDEYSVGAEDIARSLEKGVIGQDHACRAVAEAIARLKAGMHDPDKPIGTFLFVGPTGVGKTELAKRLGAYLFGHEDRLIRLDMSEYLLPGSAQRLLAAGAGIASLAERVRQQPLSVVLFDEIEKAHPEVFDLLLGVLGEGRLTDELGQLVDFRMCSIVMTSNVGVSEAAEVGFGAGGRPDLLRAVRRHFRPEFTNRLDQVVVFSKLSGPDVERITDLEFQKLATRVGFVRRGLRIALERSGRAYLARYGYRPEQGARPLKRLIEERVIGAVAAKMAEDPTFAGTTIRVFGAGDAEIAKLSPEERRAAIVLG